MNFALDPLFFLFPQPKFKVVLSILSSKTFYLSACHPVTTAMGATLGFHLLSQVVFLNGYKISLTQHALLQCDLAISSVKSWSLILLPLNLGRSQDLFRC